MSIHFKTPIAFVAVSMAWAQGGPPPGGTPPGGTTTSVTYYATYKLDGGSATQSNQTYVATATDTSRVWVTDSGVLTLTNPAIKTSGNTTSQDNSSFAGLNAGLLATAGGVVNVTGGTITTTGTGANGAFSTGAGSSVTLSGVTINASADGAHAVTATQTGSMTLTNVTMTTAGGSASAIATDRGGGTISVTGGAVTVTVTTSAGSSSIAVSMQALMPGLFTASNSNYLVAVRPSDSVIINGTGAAVSGYTTAAAARPGDILEIWAAGLGATTTPVAPGLVFSGAYPTTTLPTVTIGGSTAQVSYCGLVGAGSHTRST